MIYTVNIKNIICTSLICHDVWSEHYDDDDDDDDDDNNNNNNNNNISQFKLSLKKSY